MPNRILRDWTDSTRIEKLNAEEERFFLRLIMKADDFGIFHGDLRLLKASLFPLLTDIRLSVVRQWRDTCVAVGLCRLYTDERQREFLIINDFNQRTRAKDSKYPTPDGHLTVTCQSSDRHMLTETETETETETKAETARTHAQEAAIPTLEEIQTQGQFIGASMELCEKFFDHYQGKQLWFNQWNRIIDWKHELRTWKKNGLKTNGKGNGNKPIIDRNKGTANEGAASEYAGCGIVG